MLRHVFFLSALVLALPARSQSVPEGFAAETVSSSPATKAVGFALLPDHRIFVIGHQSGEVNLLVNGVRSEKPAGVIPGLTISSEQGLLGIAVDPDFPDSNYVYLYYSSDAGANRVSRFEVKGDLDDPTSDSLVVDASSELILLSMKDDSRFHNAGTLRFGADKTLYVSHGDDVKFKFWEEGEEYLQDLTNLYGKILRIQRNGSPAEDNPTFPSGASGARSEIFAIGLRNPFRFSIDPATGQLFIGDVGTDLREELNLSSGGENFGYPQTEGSEFFYEEADLSAPDPTPPIFDYHRDNGRAVIALATYRPADPPLDAGFPPEYDGAHFYNDYYERQLRYLRKSDTGAWESVVFGTGFGALVDASLGPDGSLYVLSYGGPLRRIAYSYPNVDAEKPPVAFELELDQNHPNPFRDRTTFTYRVPTSDFVRIDVFDLLGRRVGTLVDAWQNSGSHSAVFRDAAIPAGTYLYRLHTGSGSRTRVMVKVSD